MKTKRGIQKQLKKATGLSAGYISDIISGKTKLNSYNTAKKLAEASKTDISIWLESSPGIRISTLNKKDL